MSYNTKYLPMLNYELLLSSYDTRSCILNTPKSQTSFSPTPSPLRHVLTKNPYFLHSYAVTKDFKHFCTPLAAVKMLTIS